MEGSTEGSATGSLVNTSAFAASNVIFRGVNEHRLTRSVPFRSRHSQIRPVPFRSVPQQLKIRPVPFRSVPVERNGTGRNGTERVWTRTRSVPINEYIIEYIRIKL